MRLGSLWH